MAKNLLYKASEDSERHDERTDLGPFNLGATPAVNIPATRQMNRPPSMIGEVQTNPLTSPQVKVMVDIVETIWEKENLSATLANYVVKLLWLEDRDFHSPDRLPEDSWNWREMKIRLVYAHTVKINAAFRKRAERHIRKMLALFLMYEAARKKRMDAMQGAMARS